MNKISRIFGTDGIRSLTGKFPLTVDGVRRIGFSTGTILLKKRKRTDCQSVIVGRDTRQSGIWIEKALSEGFSLSGCKLFSCGIIPTSALASILLQRKFLGGVMVSASHNPAEFNGIKFFSSTGRKIPDSLEKEIEKNIGLTHNRFRSFQRDPNRIKNYSLGQVLYSQFLKDALPSSFSLKGLRWVLDCANGSASKIAPEIFKFFGADVITIHHQPNGKNINLNCGALDPKSLQKEILKSGASGGCAFDGDADRVQFADEMGHLMNGDILLGMAAQHLKKNKELRKNCVVTTVMANYGFFQQMKKDHIRVIVTEVGDRSVWKMLKSSGAVLGGEQSGHIIFPQILPTGDGLLTALKILSIVKESNQKLSFFKKRFPNFPQLLLNLKIRRKIPVENLPELQKAIRQAELSLNGNGRILVRYSGTEPLLRIMVEGKSSKEIEKIAKHVFGVAQTVLE